MIRPATKQDIETLIGPVTVTTRGLVVDINGVPVGMIGLSYDRGAIRAFVEITPELKPHKREAAECMRAFRKMLDELNIRPIAVVDPEEPATVRRVQRMGFEKMAESRDGDVYRCNMQ